MNPLFKNQYFNIEWIKYIDSNWFQMMEFETYDFYGS